MSGLKIFCGALGLAFGLALGLAAQADALSTLNDTELFKKAQAEVAAMPRAELDQLTTTIATCSAVSIGQRMQHFECERGINAYWTHYNRGRALDSYIAALGGLFAGFDNNAMNPSPEMMQSYRRTAGDMITMAKTINARYRQLEK